MEALLNDMNAQGLRSLTQKPFGFSPKISLEGLLEEKIGHRIKGVIQSSKTNEVPRQPEDVASRILNFVKQAIVSRADTPEQAQQMLQQARQGVAQGLADARDMLQGAGILSESIDQQISKTENLLEQGLDQLQQPQQPVVLSEQSRLMSSSLQRSASVSQSQSAALEIVTQDGDRVEISYNSLFQMSQQHSVESSGEGLRVEYSAQRQAEISFEMNVMGELDDDEQEAIQELLGELSDVASQFFKGNIQAAFNSAMSLGFDSEELMSYSVEFQQTRTVQLAQQYQQNQIIYPEPANESDPMLGIMPIENPGPAVDVLTQLQTLLDRAEELTQMTDSRERYKSLLLVTLDELQVAKDERGYIKKVVEGI